MRNALDAMDTMQSDHPQQLELRTEQTEDYVIFSVTDQGQGIKELDKLFQAFYTTKTEGMGLGLAICRTVIENHGGKIWAENNPQGGASFHFRLPLKTQQTLQTQKTQLAPAG
jgi:signal transduction histidine kinase